MANELRDVLNAMNAISATMEEYWLQREGLRRYLLLNGMSKGEVRQIENQAISDTTLQIEAHAAFTTMRESLEQSSTLVLIEELSDTLPPSGESN